MLFTEQIYTRWITRLAPLILIPWRVIYPVGSATRRLKPWGLVSPVTMTLNFSLFCKSSVSFLNIATSFQPDVSFCNFSGYQQSSLPIPFDVLLGVAEQERTTGARCTGAVVRVRV